MLAKLEPVALELHPQVWRGRPPFGSVTSADIAAALEAKGFEIDRRKIQLDEPLKSVGDFAVAIKLHREVTAKIKVTVLAEASDEASLKPAELPAAEPAAEEVVAE